MADAASPPLNILLVDDNPDDRALVIRELEREFPALHVAEITTQEGFDRALGNGGFDLVITDYQLCWNDGLAILRAAKSKWPACPVVMFTGTGSEEIAVEAMKSGLDDYVLKSPVHYGWLPTRVRSALERVLRKQKLLDTENALRKSESLLHAIIDAEPDCIKIIGRDGTLRYMNASGLALIEADSPHQLLGKEVIELVRPEYRQAFEELNQRVLQGENGTLEFEVTGLKGRRAWMETHAVHLEMEDGPALLAVTRDISERKRHEAELVYLANHDALTGLPNRTLLADRMQQAMIEAKRHDRLAVLIFLDLDRFKQITESLGHAVGDMVLKMVAEQLTGLVREGDTVAHPGSDEFALLFSDVANSEDAARLAQKVLEHFEHFPVTVDGHRLFVTVSAGIAIYPTDSASVDGLLKAAATAMDRSQDLGGNTFQFYSGEMNARALKNLAMSGALRDALERDEFELHYQPQVDLVSGRIFGMEALLRWRHPQHGMVSPMTFIPLAEETGLIVPIGAWVLREACRQNKAWQDAGLPPLRVAVNLSARQFVRRDIAETVALTLAETGLEARFLELEITESMLMQDIDVTLGTMGKLKEIGIAFSLDDFGTGYSSLSYLKRMPIETLKIDRSFVCDIPGDKDDTAIAAAIVAMALTLNIRVIAEGVETSEQLAFLHSQKCTSMQGYYFSKPLPAADFALLLQQGKTLEGAT
ncbi:MAG: putative bifunctional diguanylate cyclase/phosphodiesterase [Sulfuricella sp.]